MLTRRLLLGAAAWMPLPRLFERARSGAYAALVRLDPTGTRFALAINLEQIALDYPEALRE